jgi:hypothetical protein
MRAAEFLFCSVFCVFRGCYPGHMRSRLEMCVCVCVCELDICGD